MVMIIMFLIYFYNLDNRLFLRWVFNFNDLVIGKVGKCCIYYLIYFGFCIIMWLGVFLFG